MPFYEYLCSACGHALEVLQKISDPPLTRCPQCGGDTLRKQISVAAFRLKGTGWYETDFKNKAKPAADKSAGDKSADAKSAAKADSKKSADKPAGGKQTTAKPADKSKS